MTSAKRDGKELLSSVISPNFVRATIDNDALPQVPRVVANTIMGINRFRRAMKTLKAKSVKVFEENGFVTAQITWKMRYVKSLQTVYKFDGDGVMGMAMTLTPKGKDLETVSYTQQTLPTTPNV